MYKHFIEFCGDATNTKAIGAAAIGFLFGASAETINLYLSIIFYIMGILAFVGSVTISLPKIFELGGKILTAIRTTFKK